MITEAFYMLFDIWILLAMLAGIAVGIIIGAIPGLGPSMAIALLIPITFSMQPIPALLLLLGVYQGAIFGGSISAILLNVPGTPSAAATALDGYPMARQGKAGRALRIALYASVVGNFFSCLVLMVLAQPLASVALDFGPAEMAVLIFFALLVIVLLGGGSKLDALIMVMVGVCAGVVGLDPISGSPRFTFNSFSLENGFALIPVLIGLFAMSEVLVQLFDRPKSDVDEVPIPPVPSSHVGWLDMWRMRSTLVLSSAIGTFIGILPGIGSTIPAFMSYGLARSRAKDPERFGKGEDAGVAAPEAANNAVTGGALVPMLALGIPGDAVTAVILGAFMLQGLAPGPFLFRDHGVEVYAIIEALLIASLPTILIGLALFRVAIHVIRVRPRPLFPVIALLSVFGAYSVNNMLFDVWVMLGAGVLGFLFRRSGLPVPPLLIGLILGKPLEQAARQALLTSGGSPAIFVSSPISIGFVALIVVFVAGTLVLPHLRKRQKPL